MDSIYLEDWNKDGNLELMVKKYDRWSQGKSFDIEVFDFTSLENQIVKVFKYNLFSQDRHPDYRVFRKWKDEITFERFDLIKVVKINWKEAEKIEKEFYPNEIEKYYRKLKDQKEFMKEVEKFEVKYYKRDKISRQFIEIKK